MSDTALNRREFTAALAVAGLGRLIAAEPASRIESIEHRGMLIRDCTLPGETRKDTVTPAHPGGIQVARDRWLLIYATRGYRGVDDDRSIIYQLRKESFAGPVIKEGFLVRSVEDWKDFGDGQLSPPEGKTFFKQHGHPVVFGVPRGAVQNGKPAAHGNLFVAKWRVVARLLDKKRNYLDHSGVDPELGRKSQGVEWVQFRLTDREDDIEIVQPVALLRQKGFERGPAICNAKIAWMNQSFVPPVPFNRDGSEWADCNHFDGGRIAALKYRFEPKMGRYEWVEIGPFLADADRGLSEAGLARVGDRWIISARPEKGGVAWASTDDPFKQMPRAVIATVPASNSPVTAFTGADGVLRLFTGDQSKSPHKNGRDPLYCWEIDPKAFSVANERVIFDSVQAKLPIRPAAAKIDMAKLLPHQGRTQLIVFRVSVRSYSFPYVGSSGKPTGIPAINEEELAACGIYYSRITYRDEVPAMWQFGG